MRRTVAVTLGCRSRALATVALGLLPLMATGCGARNPSGPATVPPADADSEPPMDVSADPAVAGLSKAERDRLQSGLDETEDLVDDVEGMLDEPVPGGG